MAHPLVSIHPCVQRTQLRLHQQPFGHNHQARSNGPQIGPQLAPGQPDSGQLAIERVPEHTAHAKALLSERMPRAPRRRKAPMLPAAPKALLQASLVTARQPAAPRAVQPAVQRAPHESLEPSSLCYGRSPLVDRSDARGKQRAGGDELHAPTRRRYARPRAPRAHERPVEQPSADGTQPGSGRLDLHAMKRHAVREAKEAAVREALSIQLGRHARHAVREALSM